MSRFLGRREIVKLAFLILVGVGVTLGIVRHLSAGKKTKYYISNRHFGDELNTPNKTKKAMKDELATNRKVLRDFLTQTQFSKFKLPHQPRKHYAMDETIGMSEVVQQASKPNLQLRRHYAMDETIDCNKWLACNETCVVTSDQLIPKHVHIISLGHPFTFIEWLSVVSAKRWIKPDKITVYTDGKQDSCWWKRALPYVNHHNLYLLPGGRTLNGEMLNKLAHMADFLRLLILYYNGGIYLDTDAFVARSFDPLLFYQAVFARQCHNLTNIGVMLAQKQNCFICRYAQYSCHHFTGKWIEHSVGALTALLRNTDKEREGIRILSLEEGFFPGCWDKQGQQDLLRTDADFLPQYDLSKIYAVHLYQNKIRRKILNETMYRTNWILNSRSMVARVLRSFLPPDFSQAHHDTQRCYNISTIV